MLTTAIKIGRALIWLIYIWMSVTIVLLFLAFLLQLLGADPTAGFVEWVYRSTERAMAPFRGIFESVTLSDDSVFDVSILFAIIVYCFVAMGLNVALDWVTRALHAHEGRERQEAIIAAQAAAASPARTSKAGYVVQLTGPGGASATAVLTDLGTGTHIDLTATGLDITRQYSVWAENETGGRLSATTFQPTEVSPTRVMLTSPMALSDMRLFGVSQLGHPGEVAADVLAARIA